MGLIAFRSQGGGRGETNKLCEVSLPQSEWVIPVDGVSLPTFLICLIQIIFLSICGLCLPFFIL